MFEYNRQLIRYFANSITSAIFRNCAEEFSEILSKESSVSEHTRIYKTVCNDITNVVTVWYYNHSVDNGLYIINFVRENESWVKLNESILALKNPPSISKVVPPNMITFTDNEGEKVGSLYVENGLLVFKGDAEQSAELFFKHVISKFNKDYN